MVAKVDLLSEIFSQTKKKQTYKQTGNVLYADPWKESGDKKIEPVSKKLILKAKEQRFEDIDRFVHFYHNVYKSHSDGPDNRIVFIGISTQEPSDSIEAEFDLKEDVIGTLYFVKTRTSNNDQLLIQKYLKKHNVKIAKACHDCTETGEETTAYVCMVYTSYDAWNSVVKLSEDDSLRLADCS